ncbi:hypothetical protein PybrP1_012608 [[Pythium] brassicae (nom. inval.)]|nr:hypothetical protein PybrP1_012608 [[Pythium] brassicae (nom. inval.)]
MVVAMNSPAPTAATTNRRTLSPWKFARTFTIGRSRRCDVVIPTTPKTRTVSKLHARVIPVHDAVDGNKPTRWLLQDLGAMNGTALNGADTPAGGSIELRHGDELVLASAMRYGARLTFTFLDDDHSAVSLQLEDDCEDDGSATATPAIERRDPVTPPEAVAPASPGFRTPPPSHRPIASRYTSSTVATKRDRHHRDGSERRRARSDSNAVMEDVEDAGQRKRSRRLEALDDQDRCMVCPICFEYFYASVTLPCSHTFCGLCVSSWFRSSLSCPQCRAEVQSLPVRNRALDDLVQRLVGESESYKALVTRRTKAQLDGLDCTAPPHLEPSFGSSPRGFQVPSSSYRNPFLSDPVGARPVAPLPNAFTRWMPEEVARVRSLLATQFGETRLQTCRRLGLTDATMKQASLSQTAVAMQNLLLDWWPYERVRDEGSARLQIFLHFG